MNPNKQMGFSLIELMVAVALIGIIAAISLPAYLDYITRSNVSSGLGSITPLRTAVEDLLLVGVPPADIDLTLVRTTSDANALGTIAVGPFAADGTGTLVFTFTGEADYRLRQTPATITLNRSAAGMWACDVAGMDAKFHPKGCS